MRLLLLLSAACALRPSSFRSKLSPLRGSLSLGSDLIERPDDEDSPEFQEYLRTLLTLQANRAKTGHSAPSSGSADAYITKLNRIKLERNIRRNMGISDEGVDTSYTDLDYDNVSTESIDPLVASNDGSGKKTRAISKEELALAQAIEQRVIDMAKRGLSEIEPHKAKRTKVPADILGKFKMDPSEQLLIDAVMDKGGRDRSSPQADDADVAPEPLPVAASVPAPSPLEVTNADSLNEKKAVFKSAMEKKDFGALVQSAKNSLSKPAPEPSPSAEPGNKLGAEALETAARALQLLVRHRGGGPFGSGRLKGADASELADALRAAEQMLVLDASSATPAAKQLVGDAPFRAPPVAASPPAASGPAITSPQRAAPLKAAPLPVAPLPVAPLPVAPLPVAPLPVAPLPVAPLTVAPLSAAPLGAASSPAEPKVVTIAQGLDAFLLEPAALSVGDLAGLRDGIIHCLGLIQNEIMKRPAPVSAAVVPAPEDLPAPRSVPALQPGETLEQQLRVTTGLLLKHRGGPSFGHGRLQGAELDVLEQRLVAVAEMLVAEAGQGGKLLEMGTD